MKRPCRRRSLPLRPARLVVTIRPAPHTPRSRREQPRRTRRGVARSAPARGADWPAEWLRWLSSRNGYADRVGWCVRSCHGSGQTTTSSATIVDECRDWACQFGGFEQDWVATIEEGDHGAESLLGDTLGFLGLSRKVYRHRDRLGCWPLHLAHHQFPGVRARWPVHVAAVVSGSVGPHTSWLAYVRRCALS